jgi:hypothetical protein
MQSKPQITWIYGPTGVGKTHSVYKSHSSKDIYNITTGFKYYGYNNQEVCLFDNPRDYQELLNNLLHFPLSSRFIYIISNYSPEDIYHNHKYA